MKYQIYKELGSAIPEMFYVLYGDGKWLGSYTTFSDALRQADRLVNPPRIPEPELMFEVTT